VRVLLNERELIAKNQLEQLAEITQEKQTLIEGLGTVEKKIVTLLRGSHNPLADQPVEKTITLLDPHGQLDLMQLLEQAREATKKCKHENEINSQIVEASHSQVEQILDALLGREKTSVYSADGRTSKSGRGSLGEA